MTLQLVAGYLMQSEEVRHESCASAALIHETLQVMRGLFTSLYSLNSQRLFFPSSHSLLLALNSLNRALDKSAVTVFRTALKNTSHTFFVV